MRSKSSSTEVQTIVVGDTESNVTITVSKNKSSVKSKVIHLDKFKPVDVRLVKTILQFEVALYQAYLTLLKTDEKAGVSRKEMASKYRVSTSKLTLLLGKKNLKSKPNKKAEEK